MDCRHCAIQWKHIAFAILILPAMVVLYPTAIVRDVNLYGMSDRETVNYCQRMGLLVPERMCHRNGCGRETQLAAKKGNIVWRCFARGCGGEKSVRHGSEFMDWGVRNRLPIRTIVLLIQHQIQKRSVEDTVLNLELDRATVFRWFALMRDVPFIALDRVEPMG